MRKINFGLDFIMIRPAGAGSFRCATSFASAMEMGTNFFRFVLFQ
jgi:hypothetical protein